MLVLLAETRQAQVANVVLERLYAALGNDVDGLRAKAAVRVIARVRLAEFVSVAWAADVVLDPIPAGGGVSAFEVLSVGTPIVFLPLHTTVIQITRAM
jgi:predicted O-linked N-acetylglucosamine transferase (SPINDLY family)